MQAILGTPENARKRKFKKNTSVNGDGSPRACKKRKGGLKPAAHSSVAKDPEFIPQRAAKKSGNVGKRKAPIRKSEALAKKRKKRKTTASTDSTERGEALYPRSSSERILDHLAKSLKGPCECTAVAFFDGKFVITANEFTSGSGTKKNSPNKAMDLMKELMEYFADIAEKKDIDLKRRMDLLLKISQNLATGATTKGRLILPEGMVDKILKGIIFGNNLSMRAFRRKYKEFSSEASFIYMVIKDMHISFCTLEKLIKSTRDNSDDKAIVALKKRINGYEIYANSEKNTHAEARILEKILMLYYEGKIKEKELYIGISKLSCLDCRVMAESFNEVFKEKGIDLKVRFYGKHDYDFSTWPCPTLFKKGYDQYDSDEEEDENLKLESIEDLIGYRTHRESWKARGIPKPAKFSQSHPQSDSEVEFDVEQQLQEYKEKFEERIQLLKRLLYQDSEEKNIKLFTGLMHSKILRQLLDHLEEKKDEKSLKCIITIACELCEHQGLGIKIEQLLTLFKTDKIFEGAIGKFAQRVDFEAMIAILNKSEKQEESPKKMHYPAFFGSPDKRVRRKLSVEFKVESMDASKQESSESLQTPLCTPTNSPVKSRDRGKPNLLKQLTSKLSFNLGDELNTTASSVQ